MVSYTLFFMMNIRLSSLEFRWNKLRKRCFRNNKNIPSSNICSHVYGFVESVEVFSCTGEKNFIVKSAMRSVNYFLDRTSLLWITVRLEQNTSASFDHYPTEHFFIKRMDRHILRYVHAKRMKKQVRRGIYIFLLVFSSSD